MQKPTSILSLAVAATLSLIAAGCGKAPSSADIPAFATNPTAPSTSDAPAVDDGSVVHGRAIYTLNGGQDGSSNLLDLLSQGLALSSGATTVTYTNAGSTGFSINVSAFAPGAFSGTTLSLGNVALASLSDNNLKVCGTNNNTKCTQAAIRVYTTGSVAGFVHTTDGYGVPVHTGTLNPSAAVGLLAAGAVTVQTLAIPSSKRTITIADFPSPSYAVSADFSNGGAGSYSMTYVVEYVLSL